MTTLDKMWSNFQDKDNDVEMEDKEPKTAEETVNYNSYRQRRKEKSANDDNNKDDTPPTTYEFAIRIKIKAENKDEAHKCHKTIMEIINNEMVNLKLYTNTNELINTAEIKSENFEYHEIGRRTKYFIVVHGVELDQPYHQIKQNEAIFESLKKNHCFIQKHSWSEEVWNIVTIGFLSGVSTKHQSKETVKRNLTDINYPPPKYELSATTIKTKQDGISFSTIAYEVQCEEQDTKDVCDYLTKTGQRINITLMKHKWRYTNPEVYINGIKKQNKFTQNIRTIPIYGVTREAMRRIYNTIITKDDIIEVSQTAKTDENGRWNVYTTTKNFATTTQWLQDNLQEIYDKHCKDLTLDVPSHFTQEVRFNSTVTFHTQKNDPHLDIATSSLSGYSTSPANSWASVVRGYSGYSVIPKPTSHTTSSITSNGNLAKALQDVTKSIETICIRLEKIEKRLDEQDKVLQQVQQFKTETHSNMDKLASILQTLEERTTRIAPRRLEQSFDMVESNKRQDTRRSPCKGTERE